MFGAAPTTSSETHPLTLFSPVVSEMSHQSSDLAQGRVWFMVSLSPEFLSSLIHFSSFSCHCCVRGLGQLPLAWTCISASRAAPDLLFRAPCLLQVDVSTGSPCTGPSSPLGAPHGPCISHQEPQRSGSPILSGGSWGQAVAAAFPFEELPT